MSLIEVWQSEHRARRKRLWGNPVPIPEERIQFRPVFKRPLPPPPFIIDPRQPRPTWRQWLSVVARCYARDGKPVPMIAVEAPRAGPVIRAVCFYYSRTREELLGDGRQKEIVEARRMAYYILRVCTGRSLTQIGHLLRKDHTSVIHGVKIIDKALKAGEKKITDDVAAIRALIG